MARSDTPEWRRAYVAAHKDHLRELARKRYWDTVRYTHEGYTHDCGAHFDNATEAYVHLLSKCESLVYNVGIRVDI